MIKQGLEALKNNFHETFTSILFMYFKLLGSVITQKFSSNQLLGVGSGILKCVFFLPIKQNYRFSTVLIEVFIFNK